MNLSLIRNSRRPDGIFSMVLDELEHEVMMTLEHSYRLGDNWVPKITNGEHLCVRGKHKLHGMIEDFETFEVTGVEGHSNLLFHAGNFNKDSEGCILVGEAIAAPGSDEMLVNSRKAFEAFMQLQKGVDRFTLTVF